MHFIITYLKQSGFFVHLMVSPGLERENTSSDQAVLLQRLQGETAKLTAKYP